MKILSTEETRKADEYTIKNEPVSSIDLMERASSAFVKIYTKKYSTKTPVSIICGTGNNGGDGLAISCLLLKSGYKVSTYVIKYEKGKGSEDFTKNYKRLSKLTSVVSINSPEDIPDFPQNSNLIDGVFGSGLSRPVEGLYAEVIRKMNSSDACIISIDIASGLFADKPAGNGAIIKPALTVTFQAPKLAFMIPENEKYTGKLEVVDIGLDKNFIKNADSTNFLIEKPEIRINFRSRDRFSHKGNFGRVLLITGGKGKMGAAVLGAKASLRSGTGLITVHVPGCGYEIIQNSVPEAMASIDTHMDYISELPDLDGYDAIGIGPGLGTRDETVAVVKKLLEDTKVPLVMDADALNILAKNKSLIEKLPDNTILTPHLKEFERLAGECNNHFDRLNKQKEFSRKYKVTVILKGAFTAISFSDGTTHFNPTGNPGMATGGSGDVLTGMVAGWLGQKYAPETAALLAVYIHGLAGDLACKKYGEESLVAGDIIQKISSAIKKCKK